MWNFQRLWKRKEGLDTASHDLRYTFLAGDQKRPVDLIVLLRQDAT